MVWCLQLHDLLCHIMCNIVLPFASIIYCIVLSVARSHVTWAAAAVYWPASSSAVDPLTDRLWSITQCAVQWYVMTRIAADRRPSPGIDRFAVFAAVVVAVLHLLLPPCSAKQGIVHVCHEAACIAWDAVSYYKRYPPHKYSTCGRSFKVSK